MTRATIVFDLDGTLVDTAPDLVGTLSWLLETEGLAPIDLAGARDLIGHGMKPMIETALKRQGRGQSVDEIEAVYARYIAEYETRLTRESRPYPGLLDALDALEAGGARLAVCTNKIHRLSMQLLEELDLAKRFAVIAGADTYGVRKPHPDHLLFTIRDAGGVAERAVMVGDSDTDVNAAKAARVPVVGFTGGYTPAPLETFGPEAIIDHYSQLVPAIETLLARRGDQAA